MAQPVKVTGIDTTIRTMQKKGAQTVARIDETLKWWADAIYRRSQVLVPKKFGFLARSGMVEWNGRKGVAARYQVIYGGPEAPYALWVHEHTEKHHDYPTTHHYLSKAVHDERIRGAARRRLGGRPDLAGVDRVIDGNVVGPKGST